jgi:hypothetical protein
MVAWFPGPNILTWIAGRDVVAIFSAGCSLLLAEKEREAVLDSCISGGNLTYQWIKCWWIPSQAFLCAAFVEDLLLAWLALVTFSHSTPSKGMEARASTWPIL